MLKSSNKMSRHACEEKLVLYRRQVSFEKKDYKSLSIKDFIYIKLSAISIDFCARLRNFLHIGL